MSRYQQREKQSLWASSLMWSVGRPGFYEAQVVKLGLCKAAKPSGSRPHPSPPPIRGNSGEEGLRGALTSMVYLQSSAVALMSAKVLSFYEEQNV